MPYIKAGHIQINRKTRDSLREAINNSSIGDQINSWNDFFLWLIKQLEENV